MAALRLLSSIAFSSAPVSYFVYNRTKRTKESDMMAAIKPGF